MTYIWAGTEKFIIDHTGEKFSSHDLATGNGRLDYARKNHLGIISLCPYAKIRFDRDESIRDVLA